MLVKIFAPAFYSRQDTKTPVRYGIITMAANMIFNLILAIPFSYVGLAMATAISGSLNAFLLYRKLASLGVYKISNTTWWFLAKVLVASLFMTSAIYAYSIQADWFNLVLQERILELIITIAIGISVYACLLLLLGVRPSQLVSKQDLIE